LPNFNDRVSESEKLFKRAQKTIPGGVNSPVRAFEPYPFFTKRAYGSKLVDVDNKEYIDYCMSYGPLILGHANPKIMNNIQNQLSDGTMYGTPTELEVEFAELVADIVPCVDMLRVVSSGTEATMHAIRVARGYTGRDKVVKFEGCYHGAHDYMLIKAGSGASTFGSPDSLGVPKDTVKNTIILPFNDISAVSRTIDKNSDDIAAIILEPVIGNSGVILPENGYLKELRKITNENEIILIFDEVITGFRLGLGGAQEHFDVIPDMVTLGKIIGGGFPIGAFGGRRDLMSQISPIGQVYQAGTLSGNPISITGGLSILKILKENSKSIYNNLNIKGEKIRNGIKDLIRDLKISAQVNGLGSMFQIFFTDNKVKNYSDAKSSDLLKFKRYHTYLLRNGIFLPPSQFETCFLSTEHTDEDLDKSLTTINDALINIRRK
jgi:glutamate-1-semialdehyde 2,1-aminomutase